MQLITEIRTRINQTRRASIAHALILVVLGMLLAFMVRFVLVDDGSVHYHANFAVYINGQQEKFDSPTFYEEVASCSITHANPKAEAHMHDNISHVVHVHSDSATWGLFFQNIDYSVSRSSILTDDGLFVGGVDENKLTFVLNGKEVPSIAGRVIGNEDVLLIDYGTSTQQELDDRYETIVKDANIYNIQNDPSACTGSKTEPFKDRVLRTIGVETRH